MNTFQIPARDLLATKNIANTDLFHKPLPSHYLSLWQSKVQHKIFGKFLGSFHFHIRSRFLTCGKKVGTFFFLNQRKSSQKEC